MAKGFWDWKQERYVPWSTVSSVCEDEYEAERMSNTPTDVFAYVRMQGPDDCWSWTGAWGGRASDRRPYFQAAGKRRIAYRWVYELVHGPLPDDLLILHSCDQGGYPTGCCNPAHMRTGSHDANMKDMTDRQRHGLSHHVVRAIRRLIEQGETQQAIAERYGLTREAVSAIATERTYKHLD